MATESKINETISILLASYPAAGSKSTMGPFLTLLSKSLQHYPNEVLQELVSPRTGIITECQFFPSLAEVKVFCDRRHKKLLEAYYHDRREEERRQALPPPPVDPRTRETVLSGLKRLSNDLGGSDPKTLLTVEEERTKAERWLDQQALLAKTQSKIELSPTLRGKLFGDQAHAD